MNPVMDFALGQSLLSVIALLPVWSAFCKNPVSDRWYSYNDEQVEELTNDSAVVTNAAYLLFYQRCFPTTDRCDMSLSRWIEAVMTAAYSDLVISDPYPTRNTTTSVSAGNYGYYWQF